MICCLAMGVEGLAQTFTLQQFQQLVWEQATRMPSYYSLQTARAESRLAQLSALPQVTLVSEPLNLNRQNVLRYNAVIDADEYRNQQLIRNSLDLRIDQRVDALGGVLSVQSGLSRLLSTTGPNTILNYGVTPVQLRWTQDFGTLGEAAREQRELALSLDLARKEFFQEAADHVKEISLTYLEAWSLQDGIKSTTLRLQQRDTLLNIQNRQLEQGFSDLSQRLLLEQLILEDSLLLMDQLAQFDDACYLLFQRGMKPAPSESWRLDQPDLPGSGFVALPHIDTFTAQNSVAGAQARVDLFSLAREVRTRKLKALPQLSVFGGIGTNRFSNDPWWAATNPFIPQQYLNVELSIPIWSWGINQLQVQQSSWSVMARQMAFEQTQQTEAQRINQLINAYNRVRPKLDILLKLEKIREVQYQLTLKKWTLGQSSVQEFYEATQQWKHSEQEYFALLREAWETYLSLQSVLLLDPATLAPLPVTEE